MKVVLSNRAIESLEDAPPKVRRAFEKQLRFLVGNLQHPSLHAKKFDEGADLWQARVNQDWRFYFTITHDTYRIEKIIPHPK
jgi:mRNA-degrading endonuclease RelE of RelBE toxin-antitoxin system